MQECFLLFCTDTPPPTPLIFEGVVFGVCLLFCMLCIFVFELYGAGCRIFVGYEIGQLIVDFNKIFDFTLHHLAYTRFKLIGAG